MRVFGNWSDWFEVGLGKRVCEGFLIDISVGVCYSTMKNNVMCTWFYNDHDEINISVFPEDILKRVLEYMDSPFFEIDLRKMIMREQIYDVVMI